MQKKLKLLKNPAEEKKIIEAFIKRESSGISLIHILEAGCGRCWPLDLQGIRYFLDGVDINKDALKIREKITKDLDNAILGDLCSIQLKKKYDVIYNSYVLEHISHPSKVLENFNKWLKPGGILILKIPDRNSVYGFFTRITPFWFHILFKKCISKNPNIGKPGFGPYPTYHDRVISRKGIHQFCTKNGMKIIEEYGHSFDLNGKGFIKPLIRIFTKITSIVSKGSLHSNYCGLIFLIKKGK